eukprot:TRINITY_DN10421_c1_g4_i1.p1 TRINITY_DN10421_c1_g4~~TRINITY_DN10421_c1_g4_i1.p1  ORF type:complete len:370 (+),score=146.01 TRINITY_DN10421_c1_g4_i1:101-1210(+)
MADNLAVLVLGGTGFIGKNLVQYLFDYNLAGRVRVVDKVPPELAYMDARFKATFEKVEFIQADLVSPKSVEKAFGGERWNIVMNLAGVTEFGRFEQWYDMMAEMKTLCAKKAAELGCDKYIEVSTCAVYKSRDDKGTKPSKETDPIAPHHVIANAHAAAEKKILEQCPDLPVCIVRLPNVYGPGDTSGILPRLTCAASYIGGEEKMRLLYSEDLRIHTLHVQDAVGGIWYVACAGAAREVYNLVDQNDTTQKKLNAIIEDIFGIQTKCEGHMSTKLLLNTVANLDVLLDDVNEDHMDGWTDLLGEYGMTYGHLSTMLCKEQIAGVPVSADGSKVEALGYQYSVPTMTADYVKHALQYWIDLNEFPPVLE